MNFRRYRYRLVLLIATLTLLVTGNFWHDPGDPAPPPAPAEASGHLPAEAEVTMPTSTTEPQSTELPAMPAPGLPLRDTASSLQARADAGDVQAACRLAMEALPCRHNTEHYRTMAKSLADGEAAAERQGNLDAADEAAEFQLVFAEVGRRCEGVAPELTARAGYYLRQAAMGGIPDAMVRYVNGESLGLDSNLFGALREPAFDIWRREAPVMLQRLMQEGHPEAVILAAMAHSGSGDTVVGALLPVDPVEAQATYLLATRLFADGDVPVSYRPVRQLAPAGKLEAEMRARSRFADYYGERTRRFADHDRATTPLVKLWTNETRPEERRAADCGPATP